MHQLGCRRGRGQVHKVCSVGFLACAALIVAGSATGACGSDTSAPPDRDTSVGSPSRVAVPAPGPMLLPPLDSPLLAGMSVREVDTVDEVDARRDQYGPVEEWGNGPVVLYGNPASVDPFSEPWVYAVLNQGSESSGISNDFDPLGTHTTWSDVPVHQLSQETRRAALLGGGVDQATLDRLAAATSVTDQDGRGDVEIPRTARADLPFALEPITSGPLDVGLVSDGWQPPVLGPGVRWTSRRNGSTVDPEAALRSLRVTSYSADPGVELLLKALNGGSDVGPSLMPPYVDVGDVRLGVRTIEDTTVLVSAIGFDDAQVVAVLDSLQPADDAVLITLGQDWTSRPPPTILSDATATVSGPALDGRFVVEVEVETADGPIGVFEQCTDAVMVTYLDGEFDGGSIEGGSCSVAGDIGLVSLRGGAATLIHGDVPVETSGVTVTLDDGSVHRPELSGDRRRAFGFVVDGTRGVAAVVAVRANGSVIGRLSQPLEGAGGSSSGNSLTPPG